MKTGQPVITSYCIGRVLTYNPDSEYVQVLHRLSETDWVIKSHHRDDVQEYRGFMWSMPDNF